MNKSVRILLTKEQVETLNEQINGSDFIKCDVCQECRYCFTCNVNGKKERCLCAGSFCEDCCYCEQARSGCKSGCRFFCTGYCKNCGKFRKSKIDNDNDHDKCPDCKYCSNCNVYGVSHCYTCKKCEDCADVCSACKSCSDCRRRNDTEHRCEKEEEQNQV